MTSYIHGLVRNSFFLLFQSICFDPEEIYCMASMVLDFLKKNTIVDSTLGLLG